MSSENKSESQLADWLDNTQRESWQLELVFSGFVIFLLIAGLKPYQSLNQDIEILAAKYQYVDHLQFAYHFFRAAYYLLLGSIIVHVFLRGLWISTIGLRSVSGDIEWSALKIAPKFKSQLNKQIGSFDKYIISIEQYCSITFSFAFLLLFSILAMVVFMISMSLLSLGLKSLSSIALLQSVNGNQINDIVIPIILILGLIYLIDFVSLGFVKRQRWLSPIYYPIYRVFGFITLAKFYRPIYYNLIDNKLGKKLVPTILPVCLVTITLMSLKHYEYSYISYFPRENPQQWYLYNSYEDEDVNSSQYFYPSINSKVISDNHIRLFVPYLPYTHDRTIEHLCPELEPGYFKGFKLRGAFSAGQIRNWNSNAEDLLDCMDQLWQVSIDDSIYQDVNFRFYEHPKRDQYGLLSIIPIHHLDHNEHFIKIDKYRVDSDTMRWYEGRHLWFYKE